MDVKLQVGQQENFVEKKEIQEQKKCPNPKVNKI